MGILLSCLRRCKKGQDEVVEIRKIPVPPRSRKKTLKFKEKRLKSIDKRATKMTLQYYKRSLEDMVNKLIKDDHVKGDIEKVRSIFMWLNSRDLEQVKTNYSDAKENTTVSHLVAIANGEKHHADLFAEMCQIAGIECTVIEGISKNMHYQPGFHCDERQLRSKWNAVAINNELNGDYEYRLCDVVWSSLSVVQQPNDSWIDSLTSQTTDHLYRPNDFFFLIDPDMMVCTHFPDDKKWQLLPEPISKDQFLYSVYVRERYHELGLMENQNKRSCILRPKNGEIRIGFDVEDTLNLEFKCNLYRITTKSATLDTFSQESLNEQLMYMRYKSEISFRWRFTEPGVYRINIFGRDKIIHNHLELVCIYVVNCLDEENLPRFQKLPIHPEIGWGPSPELLDSDIFPEQHSAIINADQGSTTLVFRLGKNRIPSLVIKHPDIPETLLRNSLLFKKDKDEMKMQLRFTQPGEYAFCMSIKWGLFGRKQRDVCYYLINVPEVSGAVVFPTLRGPLGPGPLCEQYQISALNYPSGYIELDDDKCQIGFLTSEDNSLLCELTNSYNDKAYLAQNVTCEQKLPNKSVSTIVLPDPAEYGINYFVRPAGGYRIYHVYTYFAVNGTLSQIARSRMKKLIPPPMPAKVSTNESHILAKVKKRHPKVSLYAELSVLKMEEDVAEGQQIEDVGLKSSNTNYGYFEVIMNIFGLYELNIFDEIKKGSLRCLATYHISRKDNSKSVTLIEENISKEIQEEIKREQLMASARKQLAKAMATKDMRQLKEAIKVYEKLGWTNAPEIKAPKIKIEKSRLITDLKMTMKRRNVEKLQNAIDAITTTTVVFKPKEKKLVSELVNQAKKVKIRLEKNINLEVEVVNLAGPVFAEIKNYDNPPELVFVIMRAVCFLLGEDKETIKDWAGVRSVLVRDIQRRVSEFNVRKLDVYVAVNVRNILYAYEFSDALRCSPGVAAFYEWALGMIEECIDLYEEKGGDITEVQLEVDASPFDFDE